MGPKTVTTASTLSVDSDLDTPTAALVGGRPFLSDIFFDSEFKPDNP